MAKLKDLISEYGEYEVIDKIKFKTWDATLPEEKSGSIQFESREGLQIRLEPPKSKSIWLPPIPVKKEIVRCKDCKFNEGYCENETFNHHLEPLGLDGGALFETRPDFFCAYGERKEE